MGKKIITVCGSTKFKVQYEYVIRQLIKQGWFVHSVEVYGHADGIAKYVSAEYEQWLSDLHFWKIDRSAAIYVIDVDRYIGSSTKDEIEYATLILDLDIYYYSQGDLL